MSIPSTSSSSLNSAPSTSSSSPSGNDSSPSELNLEEAFEKVALTQAQLLAQLRTRASDIDQRVGTLSERVIQLESKLNQSLSQFEEASTRFELFSASILKKLGISDSEEVNQSQADLKKTFDEGKNSLQAQVKEMRENMEVLRSENQTNQKKIEKFLNAKKSHDQSSHTSDSPVDS